MSCNIFQPSPAVYSYAYKTEVHQTVHSLYSVGQNVIIQAIHVNYTSWYGKLC